ncbi:MAG: LysR family transcriptional regulator [Cytophagaceae bacterium]
MKITIKGRLWTESAKGSIIGIGRLQLLQLIHETGSITTAAKEMGMSYRQAWAQIEILNNNYTHQVVERKVGGSKGGGTELTKKGIELLKAFEDLEKDFQKYLDVKTKELNKKLK